MSFRRRITEGTTTFLVSSLNLFHPYPCLSFWKYSRLVTTQLYPWGSASPHVVLASLAPCPRPR